VTVYGHFDGHGKRRYVEGRSFQRRPDGSGDCDLSAHVLAKVDPGHDQIGKARDLM